MADFKARIEALVDLASATSNINSFINQTRQIDVDVNFKFTNANRAFANILSQMQSQGSQAGSQFARSFSGSLGEINTGATVKQLNNLRNQLTNAFKFDTQSVNNITQRINDMNIAVQSVQTRMNKGKLTVTVKGVDELGRSVSVVKNFNKKGEELSSTLNTLAKAEQNVSQAQAGIASNNFTSWLNRNTKAAKAYSKEVQELQKRWTEFTKNGGSASDFKQLMQDTNLFKSKAGAENNLGKTFGDSLASSFGTVTKFIASYVSIYKIFNELQDGIRTVVELDTALVDLQKTSTASYAELNSFYKEANSIAKEYGTTTQQIIQGAADWSRLGFNLEDSKTMSVMSSQFSAISPGMEVDEATSGLVSTMKAFGIEADDVLDGIMSKVNAVGRLIA